jgi:hypothetical protein
VFFGLLFSLRQVGLEFQVRTSVHVVEAGFGYLTVIVIGVFF